MKFDKSENPTDIPLLSKAAHMPNSYYLTNQIYEGIHIFSDLFLCEGTPAWRVVGPISGRRPLSGKGVKIALPGNKPAL